MNGPAGRGRSLGVRVMRGTLHNLVFAAAGSSLTYLQTILILRWLGPSEIGIFAIASVIAVTVDFVSDFGIADRVVLEHDEGMAESYDVAATVHFVLAVVLCGVVVALAPLMARLFRRPELFPLIAALSYSAFGGLLRLPLSFLYRDLDYFKQRLILFVGRAAGFVVTIGLALEGAGLWCLVAGGLCTLVVTGIPAWMIAPHRPRWRLSKDAVRSLLEFSSPVWLSRLAYVLAQQGCVFALSLFLAVEIVGQYTSAEDMASVVFYLEIVMGQTMFPVLCRLDASPALLGEAFSKASRISMVWVAGSAFGLMLFGGDIVRFVLTPKWAGAELFLRAQGLALLFGATVFSWDAVFKARRETGPILVVAALFAAAFAGVFVPCVYLWGRDGAAAGVVILSVLTLVTRAIALQRLRIGISVIAIAWRAVLSASTAAAATIAIGPRLPGDDLPAFCGRVMVFAVTYLGLLAWLERSLAREALALILPAAGGRESRVAASQFGVVR